MVKVFRQVQFSAVLGKPVFKDPKRNSHRTLPLHPSAVAAMRWWKEQGWLEHVGRHPASGDAVFPSFAGDFSLSRSAEWFRADLAITEVPVLFDGKHPFTFHACRRTFMSLVDAESVPREIIGALAGHAGKTVADRHYIAKNLKRFHEAVCRLPLPTALPWCLGTVHRRHRGVQLTLGPSNRDPTEYGQSSLPPEMTAAREPTSGREAH